MSTDAEDPRFASIVDFFSEIGRGNYASRLPDGPRGDELDAIAADLNMLAEDLAAERDRRLQAEAELQDAVHAYDSCPAWFCTVHAGTGRIVRCNLTFADALGRDREDLMGRPLVGLYRDPEGRLLERCLDALRCRQTLPIGDHHLLDAAGQTRSALMSGAVARGGRDNSDHVRIAYRDVTDERALEAQLAQTQKLDAVGQLAGGVAHDFNNLLLVIRAHAELLAGTASTAAPADELVQIDQAVQRGAELTDQLLAFSRRSEARPELVDVVEVLDRLAGLLQRTLPSTIRIEVQVDPPVGRAIVNAAQLEQALLNLALNARDAMPDGGVLRIRTGDVSSDESQAAPSEPPVPPRLMIEVEDNGTGMAPQVAQRAFEPFFTTKGRGQGTGLGLSLVHGVVSQAGGAVEVDSEPGRGTRIRVLLRRGEALPVAAPEPSAPEATGPGAGTILLVEDDAPVRRAMRRLLKHGGYEVLEAGDGAEALELLGALVPAPDLVVTDVLMPRLDGPGLADRMKSDGRTTPVLFVTGHTDARTRQSLADRPTLRKPFSRDALLAAVRQLLQP